MNKQEREFNKAWKELEEEVMNTDSKFEDILRGLEEDNEGGFGYSRTEERIEFILNSNRSAMFNNMSLRDGDLFVFRTKFDLEKPYFYNESYENIFLFVSSGYNSKLCLNGLRLSLMGHKDGTEKVLKSNFYEHETTWKEIRAKEIKEFVDLTNEINQFYYEAGTTIEYIGNIKTFSCNGGRALYHLIGKWRNSCDDMSILDLVGIDNLKVKKPKIKIGDVYQYGNLALRIEPWSEEEDKDLQIYRALKNAGFTESQAESLIEKHLDKLEAVAIYYNYEDIHKGYIGDKDQPILVGLAVSTIKDIMKLDIEEIRLFLDAGQDMEVLDDIRKII